MLHVGSPVPHSRRLMEDLNCYNEPTNVNGPLDMEEDTEESRRHQSVSWANDTDILNDPERKSSYPLILSSPLDTDSADTTSSSPSSSIRSDSPSSSASGSKPHSGSATVNESSGIRANTVTEKIPIMKSDSQSSSNISSSVTSSSPPSSFLSSSPGHVPSSLSSRKGLWQKVKSNVRKKVSRMDLVESEGHSTPASSAKEKILGALLGTQNGRDVEIVNTFELAVEGDNNSVDHGFLVSRREQFLQPNINLASSSINAQTLPFKAYEPSIEIRDRKSRSVFIEVPYNVETGEAERIAVDWTARGGGSGTSLESHLQTQRSAVKMLHERILVLVKYVTDVIAGQAIKDHSTLRSLSALLASLPATENKAFREEFDTEYADVQLTAVLSSLTKSANILNDVRDSGNSNIFFDLVDMNY
ncbi:hypothetical protein H0H81_008057 [Sphagnurus paluster]|uniref:COP9 signalosome complex subunit 6 n=1 Tax=Sphagnurus paluster TaxID=117069 RepID=A0A9P7KIN2_9AGAR|nr:hypothetical protein H0H81_008057 [Sphagnurus paluster]